MAVAAGVVGDARQAAAVARLDVPAERGGAAGEDRAHDAPLDASEMPGVRHTISLAVPMQNVGQLEAGAGPIPRPPRSAPRGEVPGPTSGTGPGRGGRGGRGPRGARGRRPMVWGQQEPGE